MSTITITGETLPSGVVPDPIHHRRALPAEDGRACRAGTALVLHGLGDHIGGHEWALRLLAGKGYHAEGFDWPGHGLSGGSRGHLPGVPAALDLIAEAMAALPRAPAGIYAHSTGAFLLLHYLRREAEAGRTPPFRWIWLGSPLLKPGHRQSAIKKKLAPFLAEVAPRLTLSTGTRRSDVCHVWDPEALADDSYYEGYHSRVSARFGHSLLAFGEKMEACARSIPGGAKLLLSQGSEDTVCPPSFACEFFARASAREKTLLYLKGAAHEIFHEANRHDFFNAASAWLDGVR